MDSFYIVGGQQKKTAHLKKEWHRYQKGIILKVDTSNNNITNCLEYVSPSALCPDNSPSIVFKAASLYGNSLYLCTQTEVLIYDLPQFKLMQHISLPGFNDLHHVNISDSNNLLIAVTGLDMVVEMTFEGTIIREWDVTGQDLWKRFSRKVDYRKIETTKPHFSHPNYVFQNNNEIWATRFEQKDAICLTNPEKFIPINIERPHDGIIFHNKVYFTTIDGHIVIANLATLKIERIVDLNSISGSSDGFVLGWCRGLCIIDERYVVVGFSRLRTTKFADNVKWVRYKFKLKNHINCLPTRIVIYDLGLERLVKEYNLEKYNLNAIFSIHKIN